MGIFSHIATAELEQMRDRLTKALIARHTDPARVSSNGRDVAYRTDSTGELRKDLDAITAELARRSGAASRGPIYMMT